MNKSKLPLISCALFVAPIVSFCAPVSFAQAAENPVNAVSVQQPVAGTQQSVAGTQQRTGSAQEPSYGAQQYNARSRQSGAWSPEWQDTGASGVIDGSDVYQFLNSGAQIDGTRMEEASRKADSEIKLPSYRRMKNWQEVIDRDRQNSEAGIGAAHGGMGSATEYATEHPTASGLSGAAGINEDEAEPKHKHSFGVKLKNAFLDTAEWIGFPLSDEPPPNEVDAKLAGDLPDGPDPRVYVHEVKLNPAREANTINTQVVPQAQMAPQAQLVPQAQVLPQGQVRESAVEQKTLEAQPPFIMEN